MTKMKPVIQVGPGDTIRVRPIFMSTAKINPRYSKVTFLHLPSADHLSDHSEASQSYYLGTNFSLGLSLISFPHIPVKQRRGEKISFPKETTHIVAENSLRETL
ncbi:hypothetical protein CRM22_007379 [Opisthorchis felineus]|uniref:Uncharacterized protein n=1 Tax=Opisthorchis felineus TaxID=147828 RepID=A0A4S2LN24_OPIFE|nr:hypothetical protein CRM22_007379 [Opisthorchis felineus]